jgi:hypothetical protein
MSAADFASLIFTPLALSPPPLSFCGGAQPIKLAKTRADAAETANRDLFIGETFRWVGDGMMAQR